MVELSVPLLEGSTFQGRYRVVRCLKAGGMGAVYEVVHIETRRRRALKVMLPSLVADEDMRARFALEATATADVDSEHIVETFDAGVDSATGAPFLVMELLKGEDLHTALKRRGRLPAAEVVTLLRQAALALDHVHAVGVVHRDLKPDNLFVTKRHDGSPRLKVLDFGIAKVVAQSTASVQTTRSLGTPMYMSPEQISGDGAIGPRSDLYSLGHIAFTLLTGQPYWHTEARASDVVYPLLMKVIGGAREPATTRAAAAGVSLPPPFDAWFARATAPLPLDRFESAGEQVEALAELLDMAPVPVTRVDRIEEGSASAPGDTDVSTSAPTVLDEPPRPTRRTPSRLIVPMASLLTASVAAVLAALWMARPSSSGAAPSLAPTIPVTTAGPVATPRPTVEAPAETGSTLPATVVTPPPSSATPDDRRRLHHSPPPRAASSGGAAGSPAKPVTTGGAPPTPPPPPTAKPAVVYDPSDQR